MRRLALVLVAAAMAAAGCGEDERPVSAAPPVPAELRTPGEGELPLPPAPRTDLTVPEGEIGVIGIDGRGGVRPARLDAARDARLTGLRWSSWGSAEAIGEGRLRLLVCEPSCAQGAERDLPVRIVLSGPKTCEGGRFYSRARIDLGAARPPAVFVQAPC